MTQTQPKHGELQSFIDALPITYEATFIPQSQSRNAGKKNPSINWKVKLSRSIAASLETDYMQGIGHIPGIKPMNKTGRRVIDDELMENKAAESGINPYRMGIKLAQPKLIDVLYSLIMDSDVLNYSSFEDWASNFGYETDSRKAEKIYNKCIAIALKLKAVIGQQAIDKLQELYQDY